jgi:hypothetical protein
MKSDAFRAAAESKQIDAAEGLFSPDVVFRSPVFFKPYQGIDVLRFILSNVIEIFDEFRYVSQVETGDVAVLMFEAKVGELQVQGVDILRFGEGGLIDEMTVMVRPMNGLQALGTEMKRRFDELGATN